MSAALEGPARAIAEGKNFGHLSVTRPDGSIQSVVIWQHVDTDGNIVVNSAEGRGWPANLRRAGRATMSIHNEQQPYEFVSLDLRVTGETHDGAEQQIDALAKKYMDVDSYPFRQEGEQRVTFTLTPEKVFHRG